MGDGIWKCGKVGKSVCCGGCSVIRKGFGGLSSGEKGIILCAGRPR